MAYEGFEAEAGGLDQRLVAVFAPFLNVYVPLPVPVGFNTAVSLHIRRSHRARHPSVRAGIGTVFRLAKHGGLPRKVIR